MRLRTLVGLIWLLSTEILFAQGKPAEPAPVLPVPSAAQLAWHEMETNAFIHFTTNTFTGKEWGYGDEDPRIFDPKQFDPAQWTAILKETGFKGLILTAKHHDGFALWPSRYSTYTIQKSPYKKGKGDIVGEVAVAARNEGLKFGIYLSPWDRNHKDYGQPAYITYYRNQLRELFSNYGPIFEMWFDGANGGDGFYGGAREKRNIDAANYYQWPGTLDQVRSLQPDVIFFSDAGPGVRWVGNEQGRAGITNWNMISTDTLYAGKPGITELLNTGSEDGKTWIPAETDVSIRPGWFYHAGEDDQVKSPEQLFEIYLNSVGRGSTLLLNIPPDQRGLIHDKDIRSLRGFKRILDEEFATDLARIGKIKGSDHRLDLPDYSPSKLNDGDKNTYWATNDGVTQAWLELDLEKEQDLKYIILQEFIKLGQRVKEFNVEVWQDNKWVEAASGTTIGYKRILKLNGINTARIRVNIRQSRGPILLSNLQVF